MKFRKITLVIAFAFLNIIAIDGYGYDVSTHTSNFQTYNPGSKHHTMMGSYTTQIKSNHFIPTKMQM